MKASSKIDRLQRVDIQSVVEFNRDRMKSYRRWFRDTGEAWAAMKELDEVLSALAKHAPFKRGETVELQQAKQGGRKRPLTVPWIEDGATATVLCVNFGPLGWRVGVRLDGEDQRDIYPVDPDMLRTCKKKGKP